MADQNEELTADHVFDGGTMDCGSGLILLIRENMLQVPANGLLEIRSAEPSVESELPPWCRMVGHTHVQSTEIQTGQWRHFVRRGSDTNSETLDLETDKQKALEFKWSLRARRTDNNETTVYARNFTWKTGASINFDKTGNSPGALEQLLGSLVSDVLGGFATSCSRQGLLIDELEGTINATLHNSLAAVGLEAGDPSIKNVNLVVYVTSPANEDTLRQIWLLGLAAATVYQTMTKACAIEARIVFL